MSKQENKKTTKKKKITGRRILNSFILLFLAAILITGTITFFVVQGIAQDAKKQFNTADIFSPQSTKILDQNGKIIFEFGKELRENITYEQLPQSLIDAFLSIEDSRFFTHNGFDLPRTMKSMMNNIQNGNFSQGGSTLTMQMIDNFYTAKHSTDEDSIFRKFELKAQEIFLSMDVEKTMSKEEIITAYLNQINFGGYARGVQKGAQYYFGKNVEQLTLSECAFLAGVINGPNAYNPYVGVEYDENTGEQIMNAEGKPRDHYQYAVTRRNETLELMKYHGYISQEEYDLAVHSSLAFQLIGNDATYTAKYQSYIDVVLKEAQEMTGLDPADTEMIIYTYMDTGAQELAESILDGTAGIPYPANRPAKFQVGFTLEDNQTGRILAIGGGRDYAADPTNKRMRSETPKSPGSTMKPIMDYVLTFDQLGWATSHTVNDKAIDIAGNGSSLNNSYQQYLGKISLERAISKSSNTTAAQALVDLRNKMGDQALIDYLIKLGFDKDVAEQFNLQYSIGQSQMEASPTQMAAAYSAFANGGNYIKPHTISKVEVRNGKTYEQESEKVQVFSPQAAYLMSDLLGKAVNGAYSGENLIGMGNGLFRGYHVYGKTGTSDWGNLGLPYNIPLVAMKDEWMINYTDKYTIATWTGFDNAEPGAYLDMNMLYMNTAGLINKKMLQYTFNKDGAPKPIPKPDGISSITHLFGQFPYVQAPQGVTGSTVVSGLIETKFAKTTPFEMPKLNDVTSLTAETINDTNNVKVVFAPYPAFPKNKDDEIDLALITGGIHYVIEVRDASGTKTLDTKAYTTPEIIIAVPALKPGETVQICGYYKFANGDARSGGKCVNVSLADDEDDDEPTKPGEEGEKRKVNYYFDPKEISHIHNNRLIIL